MTTTKFLTSLRLVLFVLLGLTSLTGFGCTVAFILMSIEEKSLQPIAVPLSLALASVGSMVMLWFKQRANVDWVPLVAAISLWFTGLNVLGFGMTTVFMYKEPSEFLSNLGFSIIFCFTPGIFFTLLGLAVYGYEYWHHRQPNLAKNLVADAPLNELNRADKIRRAAEYRASIVKLLKQKQSSFTNQPFLTSKLDHLETKLSQLVHRLESFESNPIIQRDLKNLPVTIAHLSTQLESESDSQVKVQMWDTLARHYEYQRLLDSLVTLMRRTELRIDETLALMGTLYSQLQLLKAKDIDSQQAHRLTTDLAEQVNNLDDLLSAVDEVYQALVTNRK